VDFGAAFVADTGSAHAVEPGEGALDDVPGLARARAVRHAALGDLGCCRAGCPRSATRPAGCPGPPRSRGVSSRGGLHRPGWARCAHRPAPPARATRRPQRAPSRSARPGATPRNSSRCSRPQTSATRQSRRRRQHVVPEPNPNSWGSQSHDSPARNTNKIPRTAPSGHRATADPDRPHAAHAPAATARCDATDHRRRPTDVNVTAHLQHSKPTSWRHPNQDQFTPHMRCSLFSGSQAVMDAMCSASTSASRSRTSARPPSLCSWWPP
jgi:hypothetical protein